MKPLSVRLCVRVSVRPSANKKAYSSFIIDSRKIIRVSGERAYNPLQDKEEKHFLNILDRISEKLCTCIKCLLLLNYKP